MAIKLHASPLAEPAPGFTNRWQLRMEADRVRQQRRQSLLILAFCIVGAGLLLGVLALLSLPLAGSPLALIMTWVSKGWVVISTANVIQDMLALLFKALVNTVSPIWLMLVLGVGSLMAVLWAASLRMLMLPRRVVK